METVKDVLWCNSGRGSFGIAIIESYGKLELRGAPIAGDNEFIDVLAIAEWGGLIDIYKLKILIEAVENDMKGRENYEK